MNPLNLRERGYLKSSAYNKNVLAKCFTLYLFFSACQIKDLSASQRRRSIVTQFVLLNASQMLHPVSFFPACQIKDLSVRSRSLNSLTASQRRLTTVTAKAHRFRLHPVDVFSWRLTVFELRSESAKALFSLRQTFALADYAIASSYGNSAVLDFASLRQTFRFHCRFRSICLRYRVPSPFQGFALRKIRKKKPLLKTATRLGEEVLSRKAIAFHPFDIKLIGRIKIRFNLF